MSSLGLNIVVAKSNVQEESEPNGCFQNRQEPQGRPRINHPVRNPDDRLSGEHLGGTEVRKELQEPEMEEDQAQR